MNLQSQINKLIKEKGRVKRWHRLVTVLACIVVFWTTYVMIMPAITMERETYCGYAGHIHSEACDEQNCSLEEHTHILACYSNPYADVEEASDWEASMEDVDLSDDLRSNVAAVAESQIGYKESSDNYEVMADGESVKGYTRYGAWYGSPYDDWDGMFVAFCLYYAGVSDDDMPMAYDCVEWTNVLADHDLYVSPEGYDVQAGDLVFIDDDPDDDYDGPDRVALVTEVKYNKEDLPVSIKTAEGDPSQDMVVRGAYEVDDDRLFAYGILNVESNDEAETETESESAADVIGTLNAVGEDYEVRVAYTAEAGFPEDVELCVDEVTAENDLDAYIEQSENLLDVDLSEKQNEARFFDITFKDGSGEEIRPEAGVKVSINVTPAQDPAAISDVQVVHFGDEAETVDCTTENSDALNVEFEADHFSVYGVVYSVDFEYEVDGRVYQFSIPGGETIALSDLAEALGMIGDADSDDEAAFESADQFLKEVDNVEFSDESLVKVARTEDDWALESLQAFDTEERLTITMKNGDVVTVKVTDAQISTHYISDQGDLYEVTVTYGEDAGIPDGSRLKVTEFSEGSEEYEYARKAVLADKKSRDESVDLGAFGFAALDISIIDPEGNEIEPASTVQVDIRIKELPGVENLSDVADSIEIQHHIETGDQVVVDTVYDGGTADAKFDVVTNEAAIAAGKAVDPESYIANEITSGAEDSSDSDDIDISFDTEVFSTYTISYYYNYYSRHIHYVDTNGKSLTPTMTPIFNARYQFLIYDIEGYEYDSTHVGSRTGAAIQPVLRASNDFGLYYSLNIQYINGDKWSDLNDDIYVVYKAKSTPTQGGSPTLKPVKPNDYPEEPDILKESDPNGDGTANLSLSITGHTKEREVEKLADVIVIMDVSGSMKRDLQGSMYYSWGNWYYNEYENTDSEQRLYQAKQAVNNLVDSLAEKKNSDGDPLVRMSLISFSNTADSVIGLTDLTEEGADAYKAAVNGLSAGGGTNWEQALQLANKQAVDSGRATFVIFVTDGDPTFRVTRGNVEDNALDMYSDGTYQYYRSNQVFGTGNSDTFSRNYNAAVVQGQAIVGANKNLYTIGISNDVTKVGNFNRDAGGKGAHIAADADALNQAFNDIASSIIATMGVSDIQMTDGITDMTQTIDKSGLAITDGKFTYWKKGKDDSTFSEWNPSSENCREAEYDKTSGAIKWNMGEDFMLEEGVTYKVTWKVWPSQKAYDILAKCKNDPAYYDTLTDAQKAQIIRTGDTPDDYAYTLRTNEPGANTKYKSATKTSSGVATEGEQRTILFNEVNPLGLNSSQISVEKVWDNKLDDKVVTGSYTFPVKADGAAFGEGVELSSSQNPKWKNSYYISTGLMTTNPYVVYEKGHDYIIAEPKDLSYNWDFNSDVYHPMVINNKVVNLIKVDTAAESDYTIDGKYYKILSGDAVLTAVNERRSNLNISKTVVDKDGNHFDTDQAFKFTVTVKEGKKEDVWFSVVDTKTNKTVMDSGIAEGDGIQYQESDGFFHVPSGTTITLTLKDGWNYRFTNLSVGSTYSIEESGTLPEGFTFLKAEATATNGATAGTINGQKVEGTINKSNSVYTAAYTNKANTTVIKFRKTEEDGTTPLAGAVIEISKDRSAIEGSPFTTTTADIELKLGDGIYCVKETGAPSGYVTLNGELYFKTYNCTVTITDKDGKVKTYDDFTMDTEGGVIVLKLKNHPGAPLPSTGGPGTYPFIGLGSILLLGAGILLWRRRRLI